MIDSFQPSISQQITGVPQAQLNDIVSNMTQNRTEPNHLHRLQFYNKKIGILLQPQSRVLGHAELPKILLVRDDVTEDSRLPLRFSITNGIVTDVTSSGSTKGELYGGI